MLAFPQTYYNDSASRCVTLAKRHDLLDTPERIVVVHDELDLPVGRLKVKVGGGLAGNKGLQSIKAHLHTDGFVRVRIGVGKPPGRQQGANHVLRRPGKSERDRARRRDRGSGRRGRAHRRRGSRSGDDPFNQIPD